MKKRILIPLVFVNLLLIAGLLAAFFVLVASPFRPWDKLFVFQSYAERIALRLKPDNNQRASFAVDLADRRLTDLAMAAYPVQIQAAGVAFDVAMQDVADKLDEADAEKLEELYARLRILLMQTKVIIQKIDPYIDAEIVDLLNAKVQLSIDLQDRDQIKRAWASSVSPQAIPFLGSGFTLADHTTYRLDGHYDVECLDCHADGLYKGTPEECDDCHEAPKSQPRLGSNRRSSFVSLMEFPLDGFNDHYVGECSACHTTYSWEAVAFDHQYYEGCLGCHEEDSPALDVRPDFSVKLPHYDGECYVCHQDTSDWTVADYSHSADQNQNQNQNCLSCHEAEVPEAHYPDFSCLVCHDVENWGGLTFDHEGMVNCTSCHLTEKPQIHYPGQCSNCHTSESWAYTGHPNNPNCEACHEFGFHKTGSNCGKCHTQTSHYPGNCSDCHSTDNWDPTEIPHRRNSNCEACHSKPETHYPGNCTTCHAFNYWDDVEISHNAFDLECNDCHSTPTGHYPGLCWQCHTSDQWNDVDIQHSLFGASCQTCHSTPTGHYVGDCSWCHNSDQWDDVVPSHDLFSDTCADCHAAPEGHWPGDCEDCHLSDTDWEEYKFDHTGYSDCNACHINDRPDGHPRGKCSKCHTTEGWEVIEPTPTGTILAEDLEEGEEATETPIPEDELYGTPIAGYTATPEIEATKTSEPDPKLTLTPIPDIKQSPTPTRELQITLTAVPEITETTIPDGNKVTPTPTSEVQHMPPTATSEIEEIPNPEDTAIPTQEDAQQQIPLEPLSTPRPGASSEFRSVKLTQGSGSLGLSSGGDPTSPVSATGSAMDMMAMVYLTAFAGLMIGSLKLFAPQVKKA